MKTRLLGLAATVGILLLLAGIPGGLFVAAGSPIPGSVPSLEGVVQALTRPDDGTMFMAVLKVIGWVAWASFAAMVLLEVVARLRGIQAPTIAGLGLQQRAAAGLVSVAALLFTASPLLGAAPAMAAEVTTTSTHTVAAAAVAGQDQQHPHLEQSPAQDTSTADTRSYVVQNGDSLYSIAEQHLGDGARFAEIAALNYGITQDDGGELSDSHWILPGWTLKIPSVKQSAAQSGPIVVKAGDTLSAIAQEALGDVTRYPELVEASRNINQPGGARLTDPDLILPGWTIAVPGQTATLAPDLDKSDVDDSSETTAPKNTAKKATPRTAQQPAVEAAPATPQTTLPGDDQVQSDQVDQGGDVAEGEEEGFPVRTAAGVGALMAAGLLGLIAVRRSRQQRRRRPGQAMPMPVGEALEVEQDLRVVADPMSVETVDLALRTLSAICADEGLPLPVVRAGRLTADQFDLYLAEPAQLPAPWVGTADSSVWTLSGETEDLVRAEDVADVPAPYPALVTIGHDEENGHVFLDLEYLGALGVIGDSEQTRQVIAALAVELATSRWADDLQVTIVGAYPELEDSLESGRVRYVPSAGRLLEELQRRSEQDRAALIESGAGDLNHARVQNNAPGAWTPEIVLFAGDMTASQRDILTQLVEGLPRVAIAAVTSGEAVGEWAIRLTAEGNSVLEPLGLAVRPQLLDDATYAQVLMVLATTDVDDETAHPEWVEHQEPTLSDLETITACTEATEADVDPVENTAAQKQDEPTTPEIEEDPAAELEEEAGGSQSAAVERDESGEVKEAKDSEQITPAVTLMPRRGPQILFLGPVEIAHARGPVEPSKQGRLTELAAILATHPGCDHTTIDACYSPGKRVTDNARNTQMSKLRRWLGKTTEGDDFLPRYQANTGYRFGEHVTSDWDQWQELLPDGAASAATENLEQALSLVRGIPFKGVRARYYTWAETLKQEMIRAIVDASYELARRRFMDGRWRGAEEATLQGLAVEPGMECLWRIRILAAHARGDRDIAQEAVDRLLNIAEDWGGELETETEELLEQLSSGTSPSHTLAAAGQ